MSVLGVTLLERNICAFVRSGIKRIVVAVREGDTDVHDYVHSRAYRLMASLGGTVECLQEARSLGTIGAVGRLSQHDCKYVAVCNVDNLTTLAWHQMLDYHRRRHADMTVAAHRYSRQCPFGELAVQDGNVVAYEEKPIRSVLISSGCYALNIETCRLLRPEQRTDVPELVSLLLHSDRPVCAFEHASPWIDVNDAQAIAEAERLVAHRFSEFECWHASVDGERLHLLVTHGNNILAGKAEGNHVSEEWDLPQTAVNGSLASSVDELSARLGFANTTPEFIGAYDEFCEVDGTVTRHHFVLLRTLDYSKQTDLYRWALVEKLEQEPQSPAVARAVSIFRNLS